MTLRKLKMRPAWRLNGKEFGIKSEIERKSEIEKDNRIEIDRQRKKGGQGKD